MDDKSTPTTDSGDVTLCRGVVISKRYAFSILGISKLVGLVSSLIAFICVSATSWKYCPNWGTFRFVEFVSMTTFWCCLVMFIVFLFKLDEKIPFIAWNLTELIWVSIDFILFLIASIVIAVHTCGDSGFGAATAFSFFASGALGVNTLFAVFKFRKEREDRGTHTDHTVTSADSLHNI